MQDYGLMNGIPDGIEGKGKDFRAEGGNPCLGTDFFLTKALLLLIKFQRKKTKLILVLLLIIVFFVLI